MTKRTSKITRKTSETQISLDLNLDGTGNYDVSTEIGFLNHMLELFSKHSLIDLNVKASGDLDFDDHHLIEDVGIALGESILKAIGDKKGISRYGFFTLPMDEVLISCALDLSGRMSYEADYEAVREKVNDFSTEMVNEFFKAVAENAKMNLHFIFLRPGKNEHHRIEAMFKAFARAMRMAVTKDPRILEQLPSTKGKL